MKTSSSPGLDAKPKPFSVSYHFTFPIGMASSFRFRYLARRLQAKIKALHYTSAPKTATVAQNTKIPPAGRDLRKRGAPQSHTHHFVPVA